MSTVVLAHRSRAPVLPAVFRRESGSQRHSDRMNGMSRPGAGDLEPSRPGAGVRGGICVRVVLRRVALAAAGVLAGIALARSAPHASRFIGSIGALRPQWLAAALALNIAAVGVRAEAWRALVRHAVGPPVRSRDTFAAYAVSLLINLVIPARAGEAGRVAVMRRRLPQADRPAATLAGSVIAHRLLDVPPLAILVLLAVLMAAAVPGGMTSAALVTAVLLALAVAAILVARRAGHRPGGRVGQVLDAVRIGLSGLAAPRVAAAAAGLEALAWAGQLGVVALTMVAGDLPVSLAAAAAVLLAINLAGAVPLWPGAVGLFQVAVVLALGPFGVDAGDALAFGVALQAVEAVSTLLVGVPLAAREGMSIGGMGRGSD